MSWQKECGLGQSGNLRQGLRLLHSRIANAALNSMNFSLFFLDFFILLLKYCLFIPFFKVPRLVHLYIYL